MRVDFYEKIKKLLSLSDVSGGLLVQKVLSVNCLSNVQTEFRTF